MQGRPLRTAASVAAPVVSRNASPAANDGIRFLRQENGLGEAVLAGQRHFAARIAGRN